MDGIGVMYHTLWVYATGSRIYLFYGSGSRLFYAYVLCLYINLCARTCNGGYLYGRMGTEQWHRIEKMDRI